MYVSERQKFTWLSALFLKGEHLSYFLFGIWCKFISGLFIFYNFVKNSSNCSKIENRYWVTFCTNEWSGFKFTKTGRTPALFAASFGCWLTLLVWYIDLAKLMTNVRPKQNSENTNQGDNKLNPKIWVFIFPSVEYDEYYIFNSSFKKMTILLQPM